MKKNILLFSHHCGTRGGPVDKFYNYLNETYQVFVVQHPLWLNQGFSSIIKYGRKEKEFKIYPYLQYFLEGLFTLYYLPKIKKYNNINLAICFDPLSFFHVYILKHFLKVKKIIYYNIDYSRTRFNNRILNYIYKKINIFAYNKSDYFFSLTQKFIDDIDPENRLVYKNFMVKNLVNTKKIDLGLKKIKNSLVYAGTINWNMDFNPLLSALKKLKDENINFLLDIYGGEKPNKNLINTINNLKLDKNISLKGAIDNKNLVNNIFPKYYIGISPYMAKNNPLAHDHMFWGNDLSAKLVEYIACGLPVIVTKNDYFGAVEKEKFGYLVKSTKDWYNALKKLLTEPVLYKTYRTNAIKFSKNYDESVVLNPIFVVNSSF